MAATEQGRKIEANTKDIEECRNQIQTLTMQVSELQAKMTPAPQVVEIQNSEIPSTLIQPPLQAMKTTTAEIVEPIAQAGQSLAENGAALPAPENQIDAAAVKRKRFL
jgi:hypothetical protein